MDGPSLDSPECIFSIKATKKKECTLVNAITLFQMKTQYLNIYTTNINFSNILDILLLKLRIYCDVYINLNNATVRVSIVIITCILISDIYICMQISQKSQ